MTGGRSQAGGTWLPGRRRRRRSAETRRPASRAGARRSRTQGRGSSRAQGRGSSQARKPSRARKSSQGRSSRAPKSSRSGTRGSSRAQGGGSSRARKSSRPQARQPPRDRAPRDRARARQPARRKTAARASAGSRRRQPGSGRAAGGAAAGSLGRALRRARTGRRLTVVLACYLLVTALVAVRLVGVQVVSADTYRELAAQQTEREVKLPARRGKIYDREGQPLAMSLSAATVYANPPVLAEQQADPVVVAAELSPLLDRSVDELAALLTKDTPFAFLARQVPREVGARIEEMGLAGVGVVEEPTRTYPAGRLAAEVIGFAGVDNDGLTGLEQAYDERLSGEPGTLRLEQAPGGVRISAAPRTVRPATPGSDLVVTLDRHLQHVAEQSLEEAVDAYGAKGGSAVALDADSGEVLAMASAPGYEPSETGSVGQYRRANRPVTTVYEPGSVSKVVTVSAALEEGLVTPTDRFTVANGYTSGGRLFRRSTHHQRSRLDVSEILAASSNVGTIQIAENLGAERLYEYLRRFGYGEETALRFPGEASGILPEVDGWSSTSLPTIAIGQGVATTLLQVAVTFQTIANGGVATQPSLVRGTVGPEGELREDEGRGERRVVSAETASAVTRMLTDVVEADYGTGRRAAVSGYQVAGKTGTAQKAATNSRGYAPGKYMATFAGFAPAADPQVVVAVVLDEPGPESLSSRTAAPVFSEIMDAALDQRGVPPEQAPLRAAESQPPARASHTPAASTAHAPAASTAHAPAASTAHADRPGG